MTKDYRKARLLEHLDTLELFIKYMREYLDTGDIIYGYSVSDEMIIEIHSITPDSEQFIAYPSGMPNKMSRYGLGDVCFTVDQYEILLKNLKAVALNTQPYRKEVKNHPYGELDLVFVEPRMSQKIEE